MNKEKAMANIDRIYKGIQNLEVQPTKHNTAIILDTLTVLEAVYNDIRQMDEPSEKEV